MSSIRICNVRKIVSMSGLLDCCYNTASNYLLLLPCKHPFKNFFFLNKISEVFDFLCSTHHALSHTPFLPSAQSRGWWSALQGSGRSRSTALREPSLHAPGHLEKAQCQRPSPISLASHTEVLTPLPCSLLGAAWKKLDLTFVYPVGSLLGTTGVHIHLKNHRKKPGLQNDFDKCIKSNILCILIRFISCVQTNRIKVCVWFWKCSRLLNFCHNINSCLPL